MDIKYLKDIVVARYNRAYEDNKDTISQIIGNALMWTCDRSWSDYESRIAWDIAIKYNILDDLRQLVGEEQYWNIIESDKTELITVALKKSKIVY